MILTSVKKRILGIHIVHNVFYIVRKYVYLHFTALCTVYTVRMYKIYGQCICVLHNAIVFTLSARYICFIIIFEEVHDDEMI